MVLQTFLIYIAITSTVMLVTFGRKVTKIRSLQKTKKIVTPVIKWGTLIYSRQIFTSMAIRAQ